MREIPTGTKSERRVNEECTKSERRNVLRSTDGPAVNAPTGHVTIASIGVMRAGGGCPQGDGVAIGREQLQSFSL